MRISVVLFVLFVFLSVPQITSAASIKINEFYAAGSTTSNPDWVEVYKEGFDISLYQLIDAINNKKDLANSTCSGNFCTIDWYNSLNNSGDTIRLVLKTSPDTSIDEIVYPSSIAVPSPGQSAGRNPDNTGGWTIFSLPTKGSANSSSAQTPTPTPTPTLTPTTTPNSNTFIISNTPTQINSDQSFITSINLSLPDKPNTNFYIKGAFKHPDKPNNYFGLTKVGEKWVKNSSSYVNQYPVKTDQSGNWSGLLEVKIDPEDSGYLGSGDYIFRVARYDPLIWSNEATIHINNVEIAQESSSDNQVSFETTANPSPTTAPVLTKSSTTQSKSSTKIASIAGISKNAIPSIKPSSSPSAEVKVTPEKQNNPFIYTGIIFIIAGVGSLGYLILRKNETIYNYLRKRN